MSRSPGPPKPSASGYSRPNPLMALLGAWMLEAIVGVTSSSAAIESYDASRTLQFLQARRRQQAVEAQKTSVYYGFQFANRIRNSGITFTNVAVDDAGKSYKASHYDHGNGIAAADVDGDGFADLYFPTHLGTNQLWRNRGNGTFEDITAMAGVGMPHSIAVAAAFADIDNDGDPDLFVTTIRHGNHLFENTGAGIFRDITREAGLVSALHSAGALFFDYDRDGRLDLLICHVGRFTTDTLGPGGYHVSRTDAFQGHLFPDRFEPVALWRNLGNRRFKDVSSETGFVARGWHGDAAVNDLNGDGFPDVYLANMQGDDHFLVNRDGHGWEDRTAAYFPRTPWGSTGVQFFDFNQDAHPDLLVLDMHSDMTQPQTEQALDFRLEIEKRKSEAWCSIQWTDEYLQGASNNIFGNALFEGSLRPPLREISASTGAETYWPWGASVGDLNADGYPDVFITAGMGYPFRYAVNSLLLNAGGQRFVDAEFLTGIEPRLDRQVEQVWFRLDCDGADKSHPGCAGKSGRVDIMGSVASRSSVILDIDNDGDLDLVTNEIQGPPQVYISNLTERRTVRWLGVRLRGNASNRDGLGARVTVSAGGRAWYQWNDGKSGYLSQSRLPLYFGLENAESADAIDVAWPSGKRQRMQGPLPSGRVITMAEPER